MGFLSRLFAKKRERPVPVVSNSSSAVPSPKPVRIEDLISQVESEIQSERYAASDALVRMGGVTLPHLISSLAHPKNEDTRGVLLWTLQEICPRYDDPRTSLSQLEPVLACVQHKDPGSRANAIWVLGRLNSAGSKSFMLAALDDPDPRVRRVATEGLSQSKERDEASIEPMLKMLRDSDSLVRRAAAKGVGNFKIFHTEKVIAAVRSLLNDADAEVRQQAQTSLRNMGQNQGES